MAHSFPLHVTGGKLPLNFEPTPGEMYRAMIPRLRAKVTSDDIILGSTESNEPAYNAGPWFTAYSWRFWSDPMLKYVATLGILSAPFTLTASASPTENRTQFIQNSSGTIALLLDTYVPRAVVLPDTGATIIIDGSLGNSFLARLSANATIVLSNITESQKITLCLINNGTDYTVTWPKAVRWSGAAPTQPTADAGQAATGVYVIRKSDAAATSKTYTDGATTASSTAFVSIADEFTANDVGKYISGGSIPSGTSIVTFTDTKHVVMSLPAASTASSVHFTISYDLFGEHAGSFDTSNETAITTIPGGTGSVTPTYGFFAGTGDGTGVP